MKITERGRHELFIESKIEEEKKLMCFLSCFKITSYEGFNNKTGMIEYSVRYPLELR